MTIPYAIFNNSLFQSSLLDKYLQICFFLLIFCMINSFPSFLLSSRYFSLFLFPWFHNFHRLCFSHHHSIPKFFYVDLGLFILLEVLPVASSKAQNFPIDFYKSTLPDIRTEIIRDTAVIYFPYASLRLQTFSWCLSFPLSLSHMLVNSLCWMIHSSLGRTFMFCTNFHWSLLTNQWLRTFLSLKSLFPTRMFMGSKNSEIFFTLLQNPYLHADPHNLLPYLQLFHFLQLLRYPLSFRNSPRTCWKALLWNQILMKE